MQFIETRGNDGQRPSSVSFSNAILSPSASFGGIYSPHSFPPLPDNFFEMAVQFSYKELAFALLKHFEIDVEDSLLQKAVALYDQFDNSQNPVPVERLKNNQWVCELYHGPTRAFKDMALQPFGVILSALALEKQKSLLILTATSGDTGPAALETFRNSPNIKVTCLYPDGGTSDVQRLQMVTESASNLKVFGIHGNFDDAQSALKSLLGSVGFNQSLSAMGISLSAANSVNFGRIIFQIIYHIHAYLELLRKKEIVIGEQIYLHVPSGNFGNALGAFYARMIGLPVKKICIASNSNNVLTDLIKTGCYDIRNRSLIATNSPAMDILKSSNVERVLFELYGATRTHDLMLQLDQNRYYQLAPEEHALLCVYFSASFSTDEECQQAMSEAFSNGYLLDPHTATCIKSCSEIEDTKAQHIIYATAEWTKFAPAVNLAINNVADLTDQEALSAIASAANIKIPDRINQLFEKPVIHKTVVDPAEIEPNVLAFLKA
ncbi:MAG: threonine synthase [Gammaproteobacteria bacterium]|jgi:threonine synthase